MTSGSEGAGSRSMSGPVKDEIDGTEPVIQIEDLDVGSLEASRTPSTPLSDLQVRFFRDTGYIRFPHTLSKLDIDRLRNAVLAEFESAEEPIRRAPDGQVMRVSRLFERAGIFRDAWSAPPILTPLQSLLGPNILFVRNRHNHATLNGSQTKSARLHRDVLQWSRPIVTILLYLDAANERTGCTRVIPTSHLLPFVGTPNNGGTWMDEHHVFSDLLDQALPIPMPAGGILAIDGLAFHAAGETPVEKPRVLLTAAYRSVDELTERESDDPHYQLVLGNNLYRGDS
jgi:phytanoyl-CoA hydroxylase